MTVAPPGVAGYGPPAAHLIEWPGSAPEAIYPAAYASKSSSGPRAIVSDVTELCTPARETAISGVATGQTMATDELLHQPGLTDAPTAAYRHEPSGAGLADRVQLSAQDGVSVCPTQRA